MASQVLGEQAPLRGAEQNEPLLVKHISDEMLGFSLSLDRLHKEIDRLEESLSSIVLNKDIPPGPQSKPIAAMSNLAQTIHNGNEYLEKEIYRIMDIISCLDL